MCTTLQLMQTHPEVSTCAGPIKQLTWSSGSADAWKGAGFKGVHAGSTRAGSMGTGAMCAG